MVKSLPLLEKTPFITGCTWSNDWSHVGFESMLAEVRFNKITFVVATFVVLETVSSPFAALDERDSASSRLVVVDESCNPLPLGEG